MTAWKPYKPTKELPWDVSRVMHLHRRCVFGASPKELQRDLAGDPQDAVTRVLSGNCRIQGTPADFDQASRLLNRAALSSGSPLRLKAWWIYRMLYSPHPLQERMTLMWHNHFATSNLKVKDLVQMSNQNAMLRQNSMGPFPTLLRGVMHDPAMLRWLDAPSNRRGRANENLARELMELFTIGAGNYSEHDVSETSRALTGWTVRNGTASFLPQAHDPGEKAILGRSGKFDKEDVIGILVDHSATPRRVAWRLTNEFFGESGPGEAAIQELAEGLRHRRLDIGWATETILRSERFFLSTNIGSRICDPTTYLLAPLRAIEAWQWPPSTPVLAGWLTRFGQDLFYPPNIGGWTGGRAWLATRTVLARSEYAKIIATGQLANPPQAPKLDQVFGVIGKGRTDAAKRMADLLLGGTARGFYPTEKKASANNFLISETLSDALTSILNSPQAHLH